MRPWQLKKYIKLIWSFQNGLANVMSCSSGLIYDDYTGTCTWPAEVQRPECGKDKIKKEVLPDGFSCPNEEVVGPNGRPLPHPTYPHLEDCKPLLTYNYDLR